MLLYEYALVIDPEFPECEHGDSYVINVPVLVIQRNK